MRFVIAIVLFVAAFLAIGSGVAQRTIWAGPDSITAGLSTGDSAPLTVIPGDVLNAHAGTQSITVEGDGAIVLAVGRTDDVLAWVGDAPYSELSYDPETGEMSSATVRGTDEEVPSPVGSDLWVQEYGGTVSLTRKINAPEDVSVLIAADGTEPAPSEITLTWPLDNSAPWSGPLILSGIVALLAGLVIFLWALAVSRRGPRRGSGRLRRAPGPTRPRRGVWRGRRARAKSRRGRGADVGTPAGPPQLEGSGDAGGGADAPDGSEGSGDAAAGSDPGTSRFAVRPTRRRVVLGTALLGVAVLLSACAPARVPTPAPTESPDVEAPPIAVTEEQLDRIVGSISVTLAAADEARDRDLAATRLTGAALAQRTANYAIRGADAGAVAAPAAVPDIVLLSLPQQTAAWPRTVFAVVDDEDTPSTPPIALVLVQEEPRSQYRVLYLTTVVRSLPDLAPADVGAPQLRPDNLLGLIAPDELALAYGDVLAQGEEAELADLFDLDGDPVYAAYGPEYKADRASNIPPSAVLEFSHAPGEDPVVSFGTNDAGQIVALELADTETVRPVEAGAAVNPNGAVKALSGKAQTTRGITATYGIQLLFYVPQAGAEGQKITLLGYTQALVSATEVG